MSKIISHTLRVSFDGDSWQAVDTDGNYITLVAEDGLILPELPNGSLVSTLLMPVECVLSRAFALPLSSARFIDQDILAQELEEHTAEHVEDWWLAWQAGTNEDGVAGMMFGLPETVREQINGHEAWQQLQVLGVDCWCRLNAQLHTALADKQGEVMQGGGPVAVFDVDASGVFFGVWQGKHGSDSDGYWRGMRRLNWSESMMADHPWDTLAENIKRSLHAMGWQDNGEPVAEDGAGAIGRLLANLHAALNLPAWQGTLLAAEDVPSRHAANLAVPPAPGLNFRHGRWSARAGIGQLQPWYRSLAIAAVLVVAWVAGMIWQNHQLGVQVAAAQQRVIQSFHKGLPDEKVMIDPLAQLRKAAGGATGAQGASSAVIWLQSIQGVERVYQRIPWQIKVLSLQHGRMTMSGSVSDLQTMSKIRQALQQEVGVAVKVRDTDLSGNQVQFRMAW